MKILNLKVNRIIIHQIFQRGEDNSIEPISGKELISFDDSAKQAFITRITSAVGEGSKAVLMDIFKKDEFETPSIVRKLSQSDDSEYINLSFTLAKKLQDKQQSRGIPGGIVVVFSGEIQEKRKLVGIIKADVHSGYEKIQDDTTSDISLKFVEELLLTPSSKLYKVAVFFQKSYLDDDSSDNVDNWEACISDYQINKADGKASAKYFYSEFCGLGYPDTSARKTQHFYEYTKNYIDSLSISEIEKNGLFSAMDVYLRVNQESTINVSDFAKNYFPQHQDEYENYLKNWGLVEQTFLKDLSHIKSRLKTRKIRFNNQIEFKAPAESFNDKTVSIELEKNDKGEADWTKILIKDKIINQE